MVAFRGSGGSLHAQFLTNELELAGIPSMVSSTTGIAAHPMTVGPMSEFQILVAPNDLDRARAVLREAEQGSNALADTEDDVAEASGPLGWRRGPSQYTTSDRIAFFVLAAIFVVVGIICLLNDNGLAALLFPMAALSLISAWPRR